MFCGDVDLRWMGQDGFILWAMAEHYKLTHDEQWLRRVAPQLIKGCDWIIRERARTKVEALSRLCEAEHIGRARVMLKLSGPLLALQRVGQDQAADPCAQAGIPLEVDRGRTRGRKGAADRGQGWRWQRQSETGSPVIPERARGCLRWQWR